MTSIARLWHEKRSFGRRGTPAALTGHASAPATNPGAAPENIVAVWPRRDRHRLSDVIRAAYERCHPQDSFADLQRRARFSKEDKGLLRDWLAAAERTRNARAPQ